MSKKQDYTSLGCWEKTADEIRKYVEKHGGKICELVDKIWKAFKKGKKK